MTAVPDDKRTFGDLQLRILDVLWERDEASVEEIREGLRPSHDRAPSTVSTVLSRLEDQGVVSHVRDGRRFLYRAEVEAEEVRRSMVSDLLDRAFGGDPSKLVGHLLREEEIRGADLDRLREMIRDAKA